MVKKVAFLSFYSGEIYRGVETYVFELANKLSELDIDVTVYQNGPILEGAKYNTVSIGISVDWKRKRDILDYWSRLVGRFTLKVLKLVDKDIDVLIVTNGGLQVLFGRIWCWKNKVKLVVPGQAGPGADDKWNLLCFPDAFIALTKFQEGWAKRFNSRVKVITIPNGVDLKKFNSKSKSNKTGLPRPIFLNVAALQGWKRQELAIEAVAKLNEGSLLLVGKGENENRLRELGNKLLPGRFKIVNYTPNEMPEVYKSADVFTFPSVSWESFGIVMLEAMASGLPVVTTDDPIRREIVGDAGLFIDPTDEDKYTQTLKQALETKWGEKPRKQAEKFSWDGIARSYKKLFEEL